MLVRTETHIPEYPEHPEQKAPNRNEKPIKRAKLNPETCCPCSLGRFSGFVLIPYSPAKMIENTRAYLMMVPYCCLKNPSDPYRMVEAMSFILLLPVFSCIIHDKIYYQCTGT